MKYFELTCTAYIKKEIGFKESFEIISKYISFSMAQNSELKRLHYQQGVYKHYTFGSFYPVEKEKIYKKGNTYQFTLRSPNKSFITILSQTLRENINNPYLLIVETSQKTIKQFFISELYSVTPVVATVERGIFWTLERDGDIIKLQRLLHDNLEKKYNDFYKEKLKPQQNFIQLGNKFRIVPQEDEISQKLAFLALSCGFGEKNSFGGGFCVGRGL